MVKIKQKKTMNLTQLIEHIEQTDYEACVYQADDAPVYVRVGRIKGIHIEGSGTVFPHDTFTVTVEEEITEDTVISEMLEIYRDATSNLGAEIYINQSINSVIENAEVLTLHIVNDDGTHTLIWTREKGLVE